MKESYNNSNVISPFSFSRSARQIVTSKLIEKILEYLREVGITLKVPIIGFPFSPFPLTGQWEHVCLNL
jgi:hypothetical protein